MTREQCLNDPCAEDRLNPRLDLMRMRQAKTEARKEARREWRWCLAFAALVALALKLAGAI